MHNGNEEEINSLEHFWTFFMSEWQVCVGCHERETSSFHAATAETCEIINFFWLSPHCRLRDLSSHSLHTIELRKKSSLLFDDFKLWNISNIYSRICEKSHCLTGLSLKIWNSSLKYLVRIIVINTDWVVVVRPFEISRLIAPPQIGQEEREGEWRKSGKKDWAIQRCYVCVRHGTFRQIINNPAIQI